MLPRSGAPYLLIFLALAIAFIALLFPPIPQPLTYHNFADHRSFLSIPNFGDVSSNLPFAVVGVWGLVVLLKPNTVQFADSRERWPYLVMFAGLILTAAGSTY